MTNKVMMGFWRFMINVPSSIGKKKVLQAKEKFEKELGFMTAEHRLVHHFVVRELPYAGEPLAPAFVADKLGLALDRVNVILDDLEKHMTFLFRNSQGQVVWAYPVTVDITPHHLTFHTGEQLYAA
jgi:hypothetical protein